MSENTPTTSRFVEYKKFGRPDVLDIVEVSVAPPTDDEVQIGVAAAGLNPMDYKLFAGGPIAELFGIELPSGTGYDLSGTVLAVGPDVTKFTVGEQVFAAAPNKALADVVTVPQIQVRAVPQGLSLEDAGALWVAGNTAAAAVRAIDPQPGETVLVISASGGVGAIAAQLAKLAGATVIGTASKANHDYLESLGIIPVTCGAGEAERIKDLDVPAPTKAIDTYGPEGVDLALELGIAPDHIASIVATGPALKGARTAWQTDAQPGDLDRVAKLIAEGKLKLNIDSTYPLADVRDAYRHLEKGHVRGKVVVIP